MVYCKNPCQKHSEAKTFFDKNIDMYVCWECYVEKFLRKRIGCDGPKALLNKIQSMDMFKPKHLGPAGSYDLDGIITLVPVHLGESADRKISIDAFEQRLVDMEIGYFAYVKFYVDAKGRIKPLVVGKSGSRLVNGNGSDVSFSVDVNDGPARRFLHECGLQWYTEQILIIKAKSEKQAYFYEWYIRKTFGLFGS